MSTSISKTVDTERRSWLALTVLLVGAFMALLDTTIVNVAIPTIRTSLAASNATLSWIVSGYALAFGLALIPAGRVGDRLGTVHGGEPGVRNGNRRHAAHRRARGSGTGRWDVLHADYRVDPADVR